MQPFQLFSCSGSGIAAIAAAAVQLWQLSSSSLAITAEQHQHLSCYSSAAAADQLLQLSSSSSRLAITAQLASLSTFVLQIMQSW